MTEKDLSPRALAGVALGEDPALFLSFRILPDRSVVVVDATGRKFVLTQADLAKVQEQVTDHRLKARGRALVSDIQILNVASHSAEQAAKPEKAAPPPEAAPEKAAPKAAKAAKPEKPAPKKAAEKARKPAASKTGAKARPKPAAKPASKPS